MEFGEGVTDFKRGFFDKENSFEKKRLEKHMKNYGTLVDNVK